MARLTKDLCQRAYPQRPVAQQRLRYRELMDENEDAIARELSPRIWIVSVEAPPPLTSRRPPPKRSRGKRVQVDAARRCLLLEIAAAARPRRVIRPYGTVLIIGCLELLPHLTWIQRSEPLPLKHRRAQTPSEIAAASR